MLLNSRQAAALASQVAKFRITPDALSRLSQRGLGPAYRRLENGRRLFDEISVRQWASTRLGTLVPTREDFPSVSGRFASGVH